jgi:hypothetical protein
MIDKINVFEQQFQPLGPGGARNITTHKSGESLPTSPMFGRFDEC